MDILDAQMHQLVHAKDFIYRTLCAIVAMFVIKTEITFANALFSYVGLPDLYMDSQASIVTFCHTFIPNALFYDRHAEQVTGHHLRNT